MDYKAILNLMKEMNHTDLTKLEIEEAGMRVCIEKSAGNITLAQQPLSQSAMYNPVGAIPYQMQPMPVQTAVPGSSVTDTNPQSAVVDASEKKVEDTSCKKIVSPMVGTFYGSSSPDKPPFVKVGDKVKKGQTVCIIEAMKLMNEIESECDGEIVKILIENEAMVEFGQPLFLLK